MRQPGVGMGDWPTGPAWFVLTLLVFDLVVALLFAVVPGWSARIAALAAGGNEKPARLFWRVCALSLLAFAPLALIFGISDWTGTGARFSFRPPALSTISSTF